METRAWCRGVWEQAESTDGCLGRGCKGLQQESNRPYCEGAGDAVRQLSCSLFFFLS